MASRDLLEKRCRKAIATVLSVKDEADPYLPSAIQADLRKVILDQFNELAVFAGDVLESLERDSGLNEMWLEKFDELHDAIRALGG